MNMSDIVFFYCKTLIFFNTFFLILIFGVAFCLICEIFRVRNGIAGMAQSIIDRFTFRSSVPYNYYHSKSYRKNNGKNLGNPERSKIKAVGSKPFNPCPAYTVQEHIEGKQFATHSVSFSVPNQEKENPEFQRDSYKNVG